MTLHDIHSCLVHFIGSVINESDFPCSYCLYYISLNVAIGVSEDGRRGILNQVLTIVCVSSVHLMHQAI